MFQNPGFIQTNKQANKLTNKLPRPMWIAVGSSKGNIVLGIDNNFGSRFVSGILNVSSAPGPRPRDAPRARPRARHRRIHRPTPRSRRSQAQAQEPQPRPRPSPDPDPDPGPDPGQTFPKSSHSRREPKVAKLY